MAHSIQQAQGARPHRLWELQADLAADRVLQGGKATVTADCDRVQPIRANASLVIQRHESFEHRALGDLRTGDIVSLTNPDGRNAIVDRETQLMWLWHQNPESVTEAEIHNLCPWIRTIRLQPHNLLVTYGELNALPDYVASASAIETLDRHVLLSLLQAIRQESYQRLNLLRKPRKETNIRFFPRRSTLAPAACSTSCSHRGNWTA